MAKRKRSARTQDETGQSESAAYSLTLTEGALEDLQHLRKSDRQVILDAVAQQLVSGPTTETRNRKPLRPNKLAQWELRVGRFRVFYDAGASQGTVAVKAVGWKEHNKLFIRGKEFQL